MSSTHIFDFVAPHRTMAFSMQDAFPSGLSPAAFAVALFFTMAAAVVSFYLLQRKKTTKSNIDGRDNVSASDNNNHDEKNGGSPLDMIFRNAAAKIAQIPASQISQEDQLLLYGLYKQATVGDRNVKEPSRLNFVAFQKYTAWGKFHGVPALLAKMMYVERAQHFDKGGNGAKYENDDIVYSDDEGEPLSDTDDDTDETQQSNPKKKQQAAGQFSSMGLKPSTLSAMPDATHDDASSSPQTRAQTAAMSGDAQGLKKEIDLGTPVDITDDLGQSLLHFAADRGHNDCASILLKAGANPNASDDEGISVLQTAVIGGHIRIARMLLEAGANPDQKDQDGDTARSYAKNDGTEEMKSLFTQI